MARRRGNEDGLHRTWKPMGERLLRELQLEAAGRVPERRTLLLDEGDQGAGGAVASSLQHHPATLLAGLPTTRTGGLGGKELGVWRSGNRYALPTSPPPRLRLSIDKDSCATLTISLVQNIGQTSGRAVASSLQHRPASLFVGLPATGARGPDGKELGVWRSGNRYALPTSPHPRLRLSIN